MGPGGAKMEWRRERAAGEREGIRRLPWRAGMKVGAGRGRILRPRGGSEWRPASEEASRLFFGGGMCGSQDARRRPGARQRSRSRRGDPGMAWAQRSAGDMRGQSGRKGDKSPGVRKFHDRTNGTIAFKEKSPGVRNVQRARIARGGPAQRQEAPRALSGARRPVPARPRCGRKAG